MTLSKRLDLKVGPSCNNNCLFCVQAHNKHLSDKSTSQIKKELEKNSGLNNGVIFTGGEPTLRKDFLDIVNFAHNLGYSPIQIQTNGKKFHNIDFCLETIYAGANSFSLAIHGHTPELHDSLTQFKGSFEQTKQGIKNLVELSQSISTNTVIVQQNYKYLPEIARLLSNISPDQAQFAFVHALGNAQKNFDSVIPKMSGTVPYIKKAVKILLEGNVEPRIEAVPLCLIQEYNKYLTENFIPDIKINGIDFDIKDWTHVRKNLAKMKFSQCLDCKFNLCCEGTWKEYPEKFGSEEFKPIFPIPNEIIIELTKKCNLDCNFCFNGSGSTKQEELPKEEIFKIIDKLNGKTDAIRFTGGEPLLRDDLRDILSYSKNNNIYTILNTNGLLFDEQNISILNNIDYLLISFHNFQEAKIKSSIFKKIKKYNKNIVLGCCTILTKENIEMLEDFYSFMQFQQVNDWFLLRQVPNKKNKQPISKQDAKIMVDKIIDLNKKHRIKPKIANALPFCVTEKEKTASICLGAKNDSGHTRLYIDSKGNIIPDYFSETILGNIKKDDISQIWLSKSMKCIRNLNYLPEKCKRCSFNVACKAGLSSFSYTDYLLNPY